MTLYKLTRTYPDGFPRPDRAVVRAPGEGIARELLAARDRAWAPTEDDADVWLDQERTACEVLPEYGPTAIVVIDGGYT